MIALRLKVLLHEAVLTAAIPQRQHKVAKEAHSLLVYLDCESDFVRVTGQIVCENDTSHRGFACTRTTHKENLCDVLLLATLGSGAILHHSLCRW